MQRAHVTCWIVLSFLFAPFLFSCASISAGELAPKEAEEFALHEAVRLLAKMPRDRLEKNHYLYEDENPEEAVLGKAFEVFRMEPGSLDATDDLKSMIKFIAWGFPVQINGESRTLIMVNKIGDEWHMIQFGGFPKDIVERSILTADKRWPADQGFHNSLLITTGGPDAILVENKDSLKVFIFDDRWERAFRLAPDVEGVYPLMEQAVFINAMRSLKLENQQ